MEYYKCFWYSPEFNALHCIKEWKIVDTFLLTAKVYEFPDNKYLFNIA